PRHRPPPRRGSAGALRRPHRRRRRRGDRQDGARPGLTAVWFRRLAYRQFLLASRTQYTLARRLTPAGKLAGAALVGAMIFGPNTRLTVSYQVFTLALAMLAVPTVPSRTTVEVRVTATPRRRGRARFLGVSVARPDPLGLVRALRQHDLPDALVILPKRYPLPPLQLPGTRRYQPGGITLASSVGDSEEFLSLREYRPGDPL